VIYQATLTALLAVQALAQPVVLQNDSPQVWFLEPTTAGLTGTVRNLAPVPFHLRKACGGRARNAGTRTITAQKHGRRAK